MVRPELVQHWLNAPELITDADRREIRRLVDKAPYFVPGRYAEALAMPEAPGVEESLGLYMGNWMLWDALRRRSQGLPADAAPATLAAITSGPGSSPESEPEELNPAEEEELIPEAPAELDRDPVIEVVREEYRHEQTETLPAELPDNEPQMPEETPADEAKQPAQPEPAAPHTAYQPPVAEPVYATDYFRHQGLDVPDALSTEEQQRAAHEKSLLVMRSFGEWLNYFKTTSTRAREEEEEQKALKMMWQKEKLAAMRDDEQNEEIPEQVFEMAVNSIAKDDLISESLAEILIKQGKYDKATEMYQKLSLRNPQKSAYFAAQIEKIQKQAS